MTRLAALALACAVAACGGAQSPAPAPAPVPAAAPAAPAPVPPAEPVPAPAPASVDITAFGATCDGRTNDSAAIAATIASAKRRGLAVAVPAGVCAYGDVIRLDGVQLHGAGDASVLYALDPARAAVFLYGDGAALTDLKLSGIKATARRAEWEATRVTLFGASNFRIHNLTIEGSAAAGIQTAQGAHHGSISGNRVSDTWSDSIHLTDRASYIEVLGNRITNSGDDGIAVVSYRQDAGLVHHITARDNVVLHNRWGRLMSVVGGSQILYENNQLDTNDGGHACVYLAQEAGYATYAVHEVVVRHNTLRNCGSAATGHAAVMLYSDGQETNTQVTLERNDIVQGGAAGMRIFGPNTGVVLDSNRIQGASPPTDISTPGVSVTPYTAGPVGYVAP